MAPKSTLQDWQIIFSDLYEVRLEKKHKSDRAHFLRKFLIEPTMGSMGRSGAQNQHF